MGGSVQRLSQVLKSTAGENSFLLPFRLMSENCLGISYYFEDMLVSELRYSDNLEKMVSESEVY